MAKLPPTTTKTFEEVARIYGNAIELHLEQLARDMLVYGRSSLKLPVPEKLSCTCGANKTYGAENKLHSSWCDLGEKKE